MHIGDSQILAFHFPHPLPNRAANLSLLDFFRVARCLLIL